MANEKKVEKSEFESFIEKARMTDNYYTNYLLKILELLKKKYYNFGNELEKSFLAVKENEKDMLEHDIIKKKLEELNEKEKLTAEEIIIQELLNDKYRKLKENIKKAEKPDYGKIIKPFNYDEYSDIFDWLYRNWGDHPFWIFKPEEKNYRINTSDRAVISK